MFPHWADRPFRDIKRGDVADLLDLIQDHHGARQADKALAILRKLMNWYATRHDDYVSAIVKGMGRYQATDRKRTRVLKEDEIRMLWTACADMGTYGAVLKTLLLTAQRKDKVATMKWSDVEDGVWTIPSASREKPNAKVLRLPPVVLDIINARPRIAGNPYVFAGRNGGPYNGFSQDKKNLDEKLGPCRHGSTTICGARPRP